MKRIFLHLQKIEPYQRYLFYGAVVLLSIFYIFWKTDVAADNPVLEVTKVNEVKAFAVADGTYENGFNWVFDVTVPTEETIVKMKFADWVKNLDIDQVANRIRFYSEESSNASNAEHAITINAANTYSGGLYLIPGADLDFEASGRQIQIIVEALVPLDTPGGSYSINYGITTSADGIVPVIALLGDSQVTLEAGAAYTDAGATATDNVDGDITPSLVVGGLPINTSTVGDRTVSYNVSDSAGNIANWLSRIVHVVDTTPPVIESHQDINADATSPGGATVTYSDPTVTDIADSAPSINCLPASGSSFEVGSTKVTCIATDASSNMGTSTFNVIVGQFQSQPETQPGD